MLAYIAYMDPMGIVLENLQPEMPNSSKRPSAMNRAHNRDKPQAAAAWRREITWELWFTGFQGNLMWLESHVFYGEFLNSLLNLGGSFIRKEDIKLKPMFFPHAIWRSPII